MRSLKNPAICCSIGVSRPWMRHMTFDLCSDGNRFIAKGLVWKWGTPSPPLVSRLYPPPKMVWFVLFYGIPHGGRNPNLKTWWTAGHQGFDPFSVLYWNRTLAIQHSTRQGPQPPFICESQIPRWLFTSKIKSELDKISNSFKMLAVFFFYRMFAFLVKFESCAKVTTGLPHCHLWAPEIGCTERMKFRSLVRIT